MLLNFSSGVKLINFCRPIIFGWKLHSHERTKWFSSSTSFQSSHIRRGIGVFGFPFNSRRIMMTASNRNIFRVTGPLCREFTGVRWIPRTKASDAELWCFLWSAPNYTAEKTLARLVFRRHRAHYDVIVTWTLVVIIIIAIQYITSFMRSIRLSTLASVASDLLNDAPRLDNELSPLAATCALRSVSKVQINHLGPQNPL